MKSRRKFLLGAAATLAAPRLAHGLGASSKYDVNLLQSNAPYARETYSYVGKTGPLNPALAAGALILPIGGQSNSTNVGTTPHTMANPTKVFNLSLDNGGLYYAADPLLSCSNGGAAAATILADSLVTAGRYSAVVLAPFGIGSTPIAAWQNAAVSGVAGACSYRIQALASRLAALGFTSNHILWMQGESDNQLATSQANYTAGLNNVIQQFRDAGMTSAVFWVALETWFNGAASSTIRAAQAAVVNGTTIKQGPDFDTLNNTYRSGGTDFNDTGITQVASMWASALP